jgi:hypothetical protein
MWDQNTNKSSILVDIINALSDSYTSDRVIIGFAEMQVIHQHQIPQVNHSFGYVCMLDKCNDEMTLKRILRSLVIEDKFAQELTSLLEIVSPFDAKSAACYDFNNFTAACPLIDLDNCQRCEIAIDKEPSPLSEQICATCPQYSEDNNLVLHETTFYLDSRTQEQNVAKVNCQLRGCNSIDNVHRVYNTSKITFDFGEFFKIY